MRALLEQQPNKREQLLDACGDVGWHVDAPTAAQSQLFALLKCADRASGVVPRGDNMDTDYSARHCLALRVYMARNQNGLRRGLVLSPQRSIGTMDAMYSAAVVEELRLRVRDKAELKGRDVSDMRPARTWQERVKAKVPLQVTVFDIVSTQEGSKLARTLDRFHATVKDAEHLCKQARDMRRLH